MNFLASEMPVVITGVASQWPAFARWSPEYLKEALGATLVPVAEDPTGQYFNPYGAYGEIELRSLPWDDLVDSVFAPLPGAPLRYLRQRPIAEFGPLAWDVSVPPYLPRPPLHTNLWLGSAGSVTATHYDSEDNFLVQIRGQKRVILYPSSQLQALYPYAMTRNAFNHSRVDIQCPDLARFPRFADATPWACELQPGEMLYIPIYWWHQVRTVEAGISVNTWWRPRPAQARRANGLRFLPASVHNGHFPHTFSSMLPEPLANVITAVDSQGRALYKRARDVLAKPA